MPCPPGSLRAQLRGKQTQTTVVGIPGLGSSREPLWSSSDFFLNKWCYPRQEVSCLERGPLSSAWGGGQGRVSEIRRKSKTKQVS